MKLGVFATAQQRALLEPHRSVVVLHEIVVLFPNSRKIGHRLASVRVVKCFPARKNLLDHLVVGESDDIFGLFEPKRFEKRIVNARVPSTVTLREHERARIDDGFAQDADAFVVTQRAEVLAGRRCVAVGRRSRGGRRRPRSARSMAFRASVALRLLRVRFVMLARE